MKYSILFIAFSFFALQLFSQSRDVASSDLPSKVLKKFRKDHKDARQEKYQFTEKENIKISFFNAAMRECWVYYDVDATILQDVAQIPISDVSPEIIQKIKDLQKDSDEKYQQKTVISHYAKIVRYDGTPSTYYINITDAVKTSTMEFSLDGKYRGKVLDDNTY